MFLVPTRSKESQFLSFDDLFDFPSNGFSSWKSKALAPVELEQDDKAVYIRAELPGVEKDAVQIEYKEGILTISGEKKEASQRTEKGTYYSEVSRGNFVRKINVGLSIDFEKGKAEYKDGILSIELPKNVQASTNRLEIR